MPAPESSSTNMWEAPPPLDPVGEAKSDQIDAWLLEQRVKELSQSSRTLILGPDGEPFESFKNRIVEELGEQVELTDGIQSKIITATFTKQDKKKMAGMEPSILLYAVDPGADLDEATLLTRMTKGLSHFLFVAQNLGLSDSCYVLVLVARFADIEKYSKGTSRDSWERLYPSLQIGEQLKGAIEAQYEVVARAGANPLQIKLITHDAGFDDLSFLRGAIQEAHGVVVEYFRAKVGMEFNEDETFHDATTNNTKFVEKQAFKADALDGPQTRREIMLLWMSRFLFALEFCLLAVAFYGAFPIDALQNFFYFLLDLLRIPKIF